MVIISMLVEPAPTGGKKGRFRSIFMIKRAGLGQFSWSLYKCWQNPPLRIHFLKGIFLKYLFRAIIDKLCNNF
jgi:hypothetical protein